MLMGKGLIVSKRVMSIQLSKNNALQGMALNVLIYPIIPSKKTRTRQTTKTLKKPKIANTRKPNYYTYFA
jgi:hypothetical protein